MGWLTVKLLGYVTGALFVLLLAVSVSHRFTSARLDKAVLALKTEQAQVKSLARQLSSALIANGEWQAATLQCSADVARLHAERDALAKANREAVARARKASELYVKPGAPSTTCAAALKALDKACPELKGY